MSTFKKVAKQYLKSNLHIDAKSIKMKHIENV